MQGMKLVWPQSSRFFSFVFALSSFTLLLSALLTDDLVSSSMRDMQGHQLSVDIGVFHVRTHNDVAASAPISASCQAALPQLETPLILPFRPCGGFIAARVLLLVGLGCSALCAVACYPLCVLPSSALLRSLLQLPALVLAALTAASALVSWLLLLCTLEDRSSWKWGAGFDSLCAGFAMATLDLALLAGIACSNQAAPPEQTELTIKEALRVSERDVMDDDDE